MYINCHFENYHAHNGEMQEKNHRQCHLNSLLIFYAHINCQTPPHYENEEILAAIESGKCNQTNIRQACNVTSKLQ